MKVAIDIPSVLITLAAVVGAVILAGAAPLQSVGIDRDVQAIEDLSRPHPRDFISIQSGSSFTVPPGRIAVIESVTFLEAPPSSGWWLARVVVDGTSQFAKIAYTSSNNNFNMQPSVGEPGVAAGEGQVITLPSNLPAAALGYLVDA